MAITAQDVVDRAVDIIKDATNVRWPTIELMRWLNDGRREVAAIRPELYAVSSIITLVSGTKQSIPAGGSRFLDAVRVMNGSAPGRALRIIEREDLDGQRPGWHAEAPGETRHFAFDERTPKLFYVYPPAAPGAQLECAYSVCPTDISAGTELTSEDVYSGALVDYVCYRAFSKDAEYAGNAQRAQGHYAAFANALGVSRKVAFAFSPNTANVGGLPPRSGVAAG